MPQDSLKKLRADMQKQIDELKASASAPFRALMEKHGVVYDADGTATLPDGVKVLPDGTKQFPNDPTGPVVEHPPASTPALPPGFVIGATVYFQGAAYPIDQIGAGIFKIMREGEPIWLYPRDVSPPTAAPV